MERLLEEVTGNTLPGRQACGVLAGRPDSQTDLQITDFRPIPCSEGNGSEYVLAPTDWEKIERMKAAVQAETNGLTVVGFYRSQSGDGLRMEKEDLALMQGQFSDPSHVFLLIRPVPKGATTAGFFFWENGFVESNLCFNEFPLDAERLRLEATERRLLELQPPSGFADDGEDAASAESRDEPLATANPPRQGFRWLAMVMACAVLCGLGGGYLLWKQVSEANASEASAASPLLLRVHTQGEDLRIAWNRNSPVFQDVGVKGLLTILDGDSAKREILLEREELRGTASIVYSPLSKSVQIRLEISGQGNRIGETVRAIKGPPSQSPNSPSVMVSAPIGNRVVEGAANIASPASVARQVGEEPQPKGELRKIFSLLTRQKAEGESWRQIPPEAPALAQDTSLPVSIPTALMEIAKAPPPPVAEKPPALSQTSRQPDQPRERQEAPPAEVISPNKPEENRVMNSFVDPKPTRKVLPVFSRQARASITGDGEVKVKVNIDAAGIVRHAEVISAAFPLLAGDTLVAARLWQFEPAKRNGGNVESETVLVFNVRSGSGNAATLVK